MNWQQKIEAQIAAIECKQSTDCYLNAGCIENRCQLQESMQALLDVAVAAEKFDAIWGLDNTAYADVERLVGDLGIALDKLREGE